MHTQWCLHSPNSLEEELFCSLEAWMFSIYVFLIIAVSIVFFSHRPTARYSFARRGAGGGGDDFTLFARRGQYVVIYILGHVLSDDRPQSVPGPCCDSQLDLDVMAGLSGCWNGCHSRAWHGVSRRRCCQPIRCPAVLFGDILNPGSFQHHCGSPVASSLVSNYAPITSPQFRLINSSGRPSTSWHLITNSSIGCLMSEPFRAFGEPHM